MEDELTPRLGLGRVLIDHQALDRGDLRLEAGDVVVITRQLGKDWFYGHLNGQPSSEGLFPAVCVEIIQGSVVPPAPLVLTRTPAPSNAGVPEMGEGEVGVSGHDDVDADDFSDGLSDSDSRPGSVALPSGAMTGALQRHGSVRQRRSGMNGLRLSGVATAAAAGAREDTAPSGSAGAVGSSAQSSSRMLQQRQPRERSTRTLGLWSIAARSSSLAPAQLPALWLALQQDESSASGGAAAATSSGTVVEEAVLSISVPFAERKLTLGWGSGGGPGGSSSSSSLGLGCGSGELHSFYAIDVSTVAVPASSTSSSSDASGPRASVSAGIGGGRVARVEKRFSELRALHAQLRALAPHLFADDAGAAVGGEDDEDDDVVDEDDDGSAVSKEHRQAEAASRRLMGPRRLVDVSLQAPALLQAKRTSATMEARRHAAQAFLRAACSQPALAPLVLAFLIGPMPGSRLDAAVQALTGGGAADAVGIGGGPASAAPAPSPRGGRPSLFGAASTAAGSGRRLVPSVSLSATRDPSLPFPLGPGVMPAASAAGSAPAGALPAASGSNAAPANGRRSTRMPLGVGASFAALAAASGAGSSGGLGAVPEHSSVSLPYPPPGGDGSDPGSGAAAGAGGGDANGSSAAAAAAAASAAAEAEAALAIELPPVHEPRFTHSSAVSSSSSSSTSLPARLRLAPGASVPFSLDSLDAFDQLMEAGAATIDAAPLPAEPDAAAIAAGGSMGVSFAAGGDPLPGQPPLHTGAGGVTGGSTALAVDQEGTEAETPLLAAALTPPSSWSGTAAEWWAHRYPALKPADEPSSAGAAAAPLPDAAAAAAAAASLPPALRYPRTGQQVTVSWTALAWDGGSNSGVVLEAVPQATFHIGDRRDTAARRADRLPPGLHAALRRVPLGGTVTVVLGPDAAFGQKGIPERTPPIPQAAHVVYACLTLHVIAGPPRPMPASVFGPDAGGSGAGEGSAGKARLGLVVAAEGGGKGSVDDAMLAMAATLFAGAGAGGGGSRSVLNGPGMGGGGGGRGGGGGGGAAGAGGGGRVVLAPPGAAPVPAAPAGGHGGGSGYGGSAAGMRAVQRPDGGLLMPSPEEAEAALRAYLASVGQPVPPPAAGSGKGKSSSGSSTAAAGGGFLGRFFTRTSASAGAGSTAAAGAGPAAAGGSAAATGGVSPVAGPGGSSASASSTGAGAAAAAPLSPSSNSTGGGSVGDATSPDGSSGAAGSGAGGAGVFSRLFSHKKSSHGGFGAGGTSLTAAAASAVAPPPPPPSAPGRTGQTAASPTPPPAPPRA